MKRRGKFALAVFAGAALFGGAWIGRQASHPAPAPTAQQLAAADFATNALRAQFFGATTLVLRDGAHAVMIDGLLTRPALGEVLFGQVAPDPQLVTRTLAQARLKRLDLLLVSHSHYDHVLDAPLIARMTGATIVGSPSTREVARGGGVSDAKIRVIRGGERFTAGDFRIIVFRALHSPGDRVPGAIVQPLRPPARVTEYKEGGGFAFLIEHRGLRILVHPSANFVPGMYRGVRADIVFLAIGGLGAQPPAFVRAYWRETVTATGAKLVVPTHWDDFLRPLDQPLLPLRRFMDDVPAALAKVDPLARRDDVPIRYLPALVPVDLAAASRSATDHFTRD